MLWISFSPTAALNPRGAISLMRQRGMFTYYHCWAIANRNKGRNSMADLALSRGAMDSILSTLPEECKLAIVGFIPAKDAANLRLTCKDWGRIVGMTEKEVFS